MFRPTWCWDRCAVRGGNTAAGIKNGVVMTSPRTGSGFFGCRWTVKFFSVCGCWCHMTMSTVYIDTVELSSGSFPIFIEFLILPIKSSVPKVGAYLFSITTWYLIRNKIFFFDGIVSFGGVYDNAQLNYPNFVNCHLLIMHEVHTHISAGSSALISRRNVSVLSPSIWRRFLHKCFVNWILTWKLLPFPTYRRYYYNFQIF